MKKLKQLQKIKHECWGYSLKLRKGNYVEAELLEFILDSLVVMVKILVQLKCKEAAKSGKSLQKEP